jgi:putative methionine-R-sulfoxide reductase with GAF domain
MKTLALDFRRFVELNAALDVITHDDGRRAALRSIVREAEELLPGGAGSLAGALPRAIGEAMGPFGWAWNGFYAPDENETRALRLAHAFGPPVCAVLERSGGPLSSGMCFDALDLNQTLAAYDAKAWPGYVSCDAASGLGTVSGLVTPVRGPDGGPVAVWDLDATARIEPGDVRFVDVLFATLSRCLEFSRADFE